MSTHQYIVVDPDGGTNAYESLGPAVMVALTAARADRAARVHNVFAVGDEYLVLRAVPELEILAVRHV